MSLANIPTFPLFSMMQQSSTDSNTPFWVIPAVILVALIIILLLAIFDEEEHDDHADHSDHGHDDQRQEPEEDVVDAERAVTATAVFVEEEIVETVETAVVETAVVETAVEPVEDEVIEEVVEPVEAELVEPEPVAADDLSKIEGIGSRISRILSEAGISTFAQLAAATLPELQKIVHEDASLHIARPDTWSEQAQLAADGKWDALELLQENLKGGRRVS